MTEDTSGYNGLLSTQDSGSYKVRVLALTIPTNIGSQQAEASQRKVFYPIKTTGGFSMTLGFPTWEGREKFDKWLTAYMADVLRGRGFHAGVVATVPSRSFQRWGVPTGPLRYGEKFNDTAYALSIDFVAAPDPVENPMTDTSVSRFTLGRPGGAAQYFYPAGQQLSGSQGLESALFDDPNGVAPSGGVASSTAGVPDPSMLPEEAP